MTTLSKKLTRRLGLAIGTIAALSIAAVGGVDTAAATEDYPDRPVMIVVSYGAGGGTDRQARLLAEPLEEILGEPVTVQNLPGAGGQVAAAALLREAPDGHTVLATNQPDLIMSVITANAPYALEDFQVIMVDLFDPRVLLVQADSPIETFDDFVAEARANPFGLSISVSQGSAQELFARWLFAELELDIRMVGYQGGGNAATAMIGGQTDATLGDDFARSNIRDEARALLVASPDRSPRWPEAPTLVEALEPYGVTPPTSDFLARYGVYVVSSAFRDAHPERYAQLQEAMIAARQSPDFQALVEQLNIADLSIGEAGEAYAGTFGESAGAIEALAE